MYAIIETGGKQLKVEVDKPIYIEKVKTEIKKEITFDKVFSVFDGKKIHIGKPILKNAKVKGIVEKQGKNKKVIIFKTKSKSNWQKKNGHRQPYTRVLIKEISI